MYKLHNSTNQQKSHKKNHNKTLAKTKMKPVLIFVDIEDGLSEYNEAMYETWRTSVVRKEKRGDV